MKNKQSIAISKWWQLQLSEILAIHFSEPLSIIRYVIVIPGPDHNYNYDSWRRPQSPPQSLRAAKRMIWTHKRDAVHIQIISYYINILSSDYYIIGLYYIVSYA